MCISQSILRKVSRKETYCHLWKRLVSQSQNTRSLTGMFLVSLNIPCRHINKPFLDCFRRTLRFSKEETLNIFIVQDQKGKNSYEKYEFVWK